MTSFHSATFVLLGSELRSSTARLSDVEEVEDRLGFRLPSSIREWYCNEKAIDILAKYSNQDWPIPLQEFAVKDWKTQRLLPFKYENQGVCTWAFLLDGSDDPPVYVDMDSNGAQWNLQAPTFSAFVYSCVWDYVFVLDRPAQVRAQNESLSTASLGQLRSRFREQPSTFGWPGNTQHRFAGNDHAILIWAGEGQADWFVGARDAKSLESVVRDVWMLDNVGQSLYDCDEVGKTVLDRIRSGE